MNIVITGAGRGIGYYTALHLAKDPGNKIFALSRDVNNLKKLVVENGSEKNIEIIPCDVSNEKSVEECVKQISDKVSGVEILINNAGLLIKKPFIELSTSDWHSVYSVNVFGLVNVTKALLPLLMKGQITTETEMKSHVLNISSMGGVNGSIKFNGLSSYSSSKGAVITISECLSEELKSFGVCVNCIALGSVDTEMFKIAFPGMKASTGVLETAAWVGDFAINGHKFFSGKIIPLSTSTP